MMTVRLLLKSGLEFAVKCESVECNCFRAGGLGALNFDGIAENKPIYIDLADVSAVVRTLSDEEDRRT